MSSGHNHGHAPDNFNRAFAIGIALNLIFVAIEAFYGWKVNSLALLADAGHNLSDVAGLVLAWGGALAGSVGRFWRNLQMRGSCWWQWERWRGKGSAGYSLRRPFLARRA